MPATYEPIATTTLGSAAAAIEFTSIESSFTDLRIVFTGTSVTGGFLVLRLNGDTGSNYSVTHLRGDGTSATSSRDSSIFSGLTPNIGMSTTVPQMVTIDFFNYAGSTNKTYLSTTSGDRNGSGSVFRSVHLYRSTSAITSIRLFLNDSSNLASGTTATLYGILKA